MQPEVFLSEWAIPLEAGLLFNALVKWTEAARLPHQVAPKNSTSALEQPINS